MTFDPLAFLIEEGVLPPGSEARVDVLAGGFWNEVSRVYAGDQDLVVKHFGLRSADCSLFPIVPEVEARAMALLRGSGLAPEMVLFREARDGRGPVLVYAYAPGKPGVADTGEAGVLLRRVHGIAAEGFRETPMTAEALLADADRLADPDADNAGWRRLRALRPEPPAGEQAAGRVFIHGDFGSGNIVSGRGGMCIIDWQCPAMGEAAEDLWSFLSPAFQAVYGAEPWTPAEVRAFRDGYGDGQALARHDRLAPFFTWRYGKYALRRCEDLDGVDPASQQRFAAAADAALDVLERG